jgi:DNA-binding transcriptional LysR family regulator
MLNWDDLRYFLAVAERGSLSGAARALKVNPATIGRHIDALEGAFGARCFDRRMDGYVLTGAGEKLLSRARLVENEIFSLSRAFDCEDRGLVGTVVVAAAEMVTESVIIPALPRLRSQHPGIRIDLNSDKQIVNLARREADIAIQLLRPEHGDFVVRRIGTIGFGLFAAADYLESRGHPEAVDDLAGHDIIDWAEEEPSMAPAAWLRQQTGPHPAILRVNRASERLAACAAGFGITVLPFVQAKERPELVRLLLDHPIPSTDIWLLTHRSLTRVAKIRAVMDFLIGSVEQVAPILDGRAA